MPSMKDVLRSGELDGYGPSDTFDAINAQIAKEQDCTHCGHHGLDCHEYQKYWSVRSFQVCPECGWTEEF
jgi:hypothetical protein